MLHIIIVIIVAVVVIIYLISFQFNRKNISSFDIFILYIVAAVAAYEFDREQEACESYSQIRSFVICCYAFVKLWNYNTHLQLSIFNFYSHLTTLSLLLIIFHYGCWRLLKIEMNEKKKPKSIMRFDGTVKKRIEKSL